MIIALSLCSSLRSNWINFINEVFLPTIPLPILYKSQHFPHVHLKTNINLLWSSECQHSCFFHVSKWELFSFSFSFLCPAVPPLFTTSTFSLFLLCQGGPCFSTQTPEQIQRRDGGSRGKVSLERVYRLTLTLGLHFSKCVCVQLQLPRSPLQRVFTF